jgi:hypothetical protein
MINIIQSIPIIINNFYIIPNISWFCYIEPWLRLSYARNKTRVFSHLVNYGSG